jgi:hypothetical protein
MDYHEERDHLEHYFESNGYFDRRPVILLDPVERMMLLEPDYHRPQLPPIVPEGFMLCPDCNGFPDRDEGCSACEDKRVMPRSMVVKCGHCDEKGLCFTEHGQCRHCQGMVFYPQGRYTVTWVVKALACALGVPEDEDEIRDALSAAKFRFALDRCALCRGEGCLVANGRSFKAPCGRCGTTGRVVVWSYPLVERIKAVMEPQPNKDEEFPF